MFIHPQPPTAQCFELGYDRYLRVMCISNLVLADLFQTLGIRMGQHLGFDAEGNVVVKLYLLGLTPKALLVSSKMQAMLVSNLESEVVFVHSVRDEPTKNFRFPFFGEQGETPEEIDTRIANELSTMIGDAIQALANDPALDVPRDAKPNKKLLDQEFLKKVTSVTNLGFSSNYQASFADGTMVRYTMPTEEGDQVKPGDYLHHAASGNMSRVDPCRVH